MPIADSIDRVFQNDDGDSGAVRERVEVVVRVAIAQQALVDEWLARLAVDVTAGRLSLYSLRGIERAVRPWIRYLEEQRIARPTAETVTAYLVAQGTEFRANTINSRRDALVAFYSWCATQGRCEDIAKNAPRLVREVAEIPQEVRGGNFALQLLAYMGKRTFGDLRNRVIVALVGSGLETISIRRALIGDVDLPVGQVHHCPRRHHAKDATLPLEPIAREAIGDYLRMRLEIDGAPAHLPLVTPQYDLTRPLSTLSMRLLVRRLCDGLGIGRGRVTTNALRCAGICRMSQNLGLVAVASQANSDRGSVRRIAKRVTAAH